MVGAEYPPRKKSGSDSRVGGSPACWFEYDVGMGLAFAGLFIASCFFFQLFFKELIRKSSTFNSHTSICHVLLCHSDLNTGFYNFPVMHSHFTIQASA